MGRRRDFSFGEGTQRLGDMEGFEKKTRIFINETDVDKPKEAIYTPRKKKVSRPEDRRNSFDNPIPSGKDDSDKKALRRINSISPKTITALTVVGGVMAAIAIAYVAIRFFF